jgi:hypothetical protein
VKKSTKARGRLGTGMVDKADKAITTRKVRQQDKLDSIMGEIGKTRGKKAPR